MLSDDICAPCEQLPCVAVIGGTHGNEMAGVHLVKSMLSNPGLWTRPNIQVKPVLGNPEAVKSCVRFVDCDLNRCFSKSVLSQTSSGLAGFPPKGRDVWRSKTDDTDEAPYEECRARELASELKEVRSLLRFVVVE